MTASRGASGAVGACGDAEGGLFPNDAVWNRLATDPPSPEWSDFEHISPGPPIDWDSGSCERSATIS